MGQEQEIFPASIVDPVVKTEESEWTAAGDLVQGDHIRKADGSYGVVTALRIVQTVRRMYNLTVAHAHTFFVGIGRWLVHNSCSDHVVLGLEKFGLAETAKNVGGRTLMGIEDWKGAFQEAIANPKTKFTISLDGLRGDNPYSKVMNAVQNGASLNASPTNWELAQLRLAGRLKDVTRLSRKVKSSKTHSNER